MFPKPDFVSTLYAWYGVCVGKGKREIGGVMRSGGDVFGGDGGGK